MRRGTSPNSYPRAHRARTLDQRAHAMRQAPTASEARLFDALRGGRLGVAFRRQVPLAGRSIADLFAPALRLVVEVDGAYHSARRAADARRDRALVRAGYGVLHIDARLIMNHLDEAVARVREAIEQHMRRGEM